MSSIREIVTAHVNGNGAGVDSLIDALMAREEEKVGTLLTVGATQFGVEPVFAAKVLMDLELGEPKTAEMRAYINASFAEKVAEYQQRYAQTNDEGSQPESPEQDDNNGEQPGEGQS